MPFQIVRNDIVNMKVDAIVNTANPAPVIGSGVDTAIHQAAGPRLLAARQKIGPVAVGDAAITKGYALDAKYVIHAVGPLWQGGSHRYSYDKVKAMIQRQKEKYGWDFLFLGANIDAAREAARFGIHADRAANYHADHQGTGVIYETVSEAICQVRSSAAPLQASWKARIDEDYKKRGK